ncbi:hypothetical protein HW555_013322 [Spodoptera exigua]|uniref:Uncharacterized protein n=1 Tax=Spodoptera exigua TaxID=7107 RepID=A0A835G5C2_SPOEX|nr:hypothetical protein HW555_013322 [Spodoptera exigua]
MKSPVSFKVTRKSYNNLVLRTIKLPSKIFANHRQRHRSSCARRANFGPRPPRRRKHREVVPEADYVITVEADVILGNSLKTLIKKRSSVKSKLTIYNNYLTLIKSSAAISQLQRLDLEERFIKFQSLHNEFDDLQTQIEVLADDAESTFTEREDFDRQFFSLVALTRSLLGSSSNGVGSEAGFKDADSGGGDAPAESIKLTAARTPSFFLHTHSADQRQRLRAFLCYRAAPVLM